MQGMVLLIHSFYLLLTLAPPSDTSCHLVGVWQNDLGSQLLIDSVSVSGELCGSYRSLPSVEGKIFALQGYVNQDDEQSGGAIALSFAVRWEGFGSLTSWAGYVDADSSGCYIKTMWHLVRPQSEEPWERIITNSSTFRRVEP